jgi:hypothetical protein
MWFLGKRESVNAWKKADFDGFREKDEIALYLSGQMLMEDLYIGKKFAESYGIKNIESNSRLCTISSFLVERKIFAIDSIVSSQVPIEGLSSLSLSVPTVSNKVCPLMQSMPLLTGESLMVLRI